jgi:rubrerythrin
MLREADEDGDTEAAVMFSQARDVEKGHAQLYKRALNHLIAQRETECYVCQTCGYVADGRVPGNCPVYGTSSSGFAQVSEGNPI